MRCPRCDTVTMNAVIDSRFVNHARSRRRRRECSTCGQRVTTYEVIAEEPAQIVTVLDAVDLIDNIGRSLAQLRKVVITETPAEIPDPDDLTASP